jgi:hypothetical protein
MGCCPFLPAAGLTREGLMNAFAYGVGGEASKLSSGGPPTVLVVEE